MSFYTWRVASILLKQKFGDKYKICRAELRANVNCNYEKNIKAFRKSVNGSIKFSTKNKIELRSTLALSVLFFNYKSLNCIFIVIQSAN